MDGGKYRGQALVAPLRHPTAAAGAISALAPPSAAATVPAENTGAVGPLVAGPHRDPDSPLSGDPSLHRGYATAVVDDAVGDLHAIAQGGLARAALGEDVNLP